MLMLPNIVSPIEILLNLIISQYMSKLTCVTVVSEESLELKLPIHFVYLKPLNNGITNDTFFNLMLTSSEYSCSDYIVQVNKPEDFMTVFEAITHSGNIRRSDKKIVVLPYNKISNNENRKNQLKILSIKETSYVANLLLILPGIEQCECEFFDLATHKFEGVFGNEQPLFLDRWNICSKSFERNENLFPHDISNLQGKEVRVAAFTYKPYVLLDLDISQSPIQRDGFEMRIIDEFCRWVNCTVKLIRDDENEWGEIYENLTGIGVLGNVVEDLADVGITALYSWYEEYVVMDFSAPIIRSAVTCIAPSPRLLPSWEMPLLPFTLYMWIGIFCTFLFASFALYVSQRFSGDKVFLTTFGIMITQSQPETGFSSWRIRSVIGWMMITGLVLDNAYGGGLASTFTVPKYEPSVDTLKDLVDRKIEWGATHDAWVFSITMSQEPLMKQLVALFHTYPAEELKRKSFTRSMAYSIEKLPAGNFAIGEYITKEALLEYTIMLENMYFEQCVVMLRKSSPYTNKLNIFIGRLHQSGLILLWETQVALQYLDYKVQLEVKLSRSKRDVETIKPLSLHQVVGIFIIYGVGVGMSSIFFIMEIIFNTKKTNKISLVD